MVPPRIQEENERSQETSSEESVEVQNQNQNQNENQPAQQDGQDSENTQTQNNEFKNPLLKGKSPEEIEALFDQQQRAMQQQNQELNSQHSRLLALEQQRAPAPGEVRQEEADPYGDNFMAPVARQLEDRLTNRLQKMVEPLIQTTQANQVRSAREKLKGELKHFGVLESHIDSFLRSHNMNPETVNESTLRQIYYQVVGLAQEQGINLGVEQRKEETQPQNRQQQDNTMIPQRRPSSSPLPAGQGNKPKVRALTEEERHVKPKGMSDEEYVNLQEMDIEEVVKPGFSKDNW